MDYNETFIVLPAAAACTGLNAPARSARVWFNGRTRASQALDVGSIPITRSIFRRWRCFVAPAIFCLPTLAVAATVLHTEVRHEAGRYAVALEVQLDAEPARVRALMTDYARLDRLSKTIVASRIVRATEDAVRVRVDFRACVLIFCRTLRKTQEVREEPGGDIRSDYDPAESDFAFGREHWRIRAEGSGTRVRYDAELVPSFFVPPLIGPWIVKLKLRDELETTAARLEKFAHE